MGYPCCNDVDGQGNRLFQWRVESMLPTSLSYGVDTAEEEVFEAAPMFG